MEPADPSPAAAAERRPWIHRHLVGVIVGCVAVIALIAGVVGLVRLSESIKNSYAVEYDQAISPKEYAALLDAVVTTTGTSDVFSLAIEHAEPPTADTKVPVVTISVTTAPTTRHPFGASWEWQDGELVLDSTLDSDDVPAGDGAFALGNVTPAGINAVDRRLRGAMNHGLTQAGLTVQQHGGHVVISMYALNRGTDDKADVRATATGVVLDGTVCHATDHPRGQPVVRSCTSLKGSGSGR